MYGVWCGRVEVEMGHEEMAGNIICESFYRLNCPKKHPKSFDLRLSQLKKKKANVFHADLFYI